MKKIRKAICAVIAVLSIILMCGFADNLETSYTSTVTAMLLLLIVFAVCTYLAGGFTYIEDEKEGEADAADDSKHGQ